MVVAVLAYDVRKMGEDHDLEAEAGKDTSAIETWCWKAFVISHLSGWTLNSKGFMLFINMFAVLVIMERLPDVLDMSQQT